MNEKQSFLPTRATSPFRAQAPNQRFQYRLISLLLVLVSVWGLVHLWDIFMPCKPKINTELQTVAATTVAATAAKNVSLEAHIMSKCPDARDCLNDLVVPAMANISSKVDFKLSYIGTINNKDGGVECKHGPTECMGNIIQLCAAELYPDPKVYLPFAACLTNEYQAIPDEEFVKGCALEHGVEFDELNECASRDDGSYAEDLLRDSVNRTANAGVQYSCTVRLNDDIRCIRDGGEWKNCSGGSKPADLIKNIIQASK